MGPLVVHASSTASVYSRTFAAAFFSSVAIVSCPVMKRLWMVVATTSVVESRSFAESIEPEDQEGGSSVIGIIPFSAIAAYAVGGETLAGDMDGSVACAFAWGAELKYTIASKLHPRFASAFAEFLKPEEGRAVRLGWRNWTALANFRTDVLDSLLTNVRVTPLHECIAMPDPCCNSHELMELAVPLLSSLNNRAVLFAGEVCIYAFPTPAALMIDKKMRKMFVFVSTLLFVKFKKGNAVSTAVRIPMSAVQRVVLDQEDGEQVALMLEDGSVAHVHFTEERIRTSFVAHLTHINVAGEFRGCAKVEVGSTSRISAPAIRIARGIVDVGSSRVRAADSSSSLTLHLAYILLNHIDVALYLISATIDCEQYNSAARPLAEFFALQAAANPLVLPALLRSVCYFEINVSSVVLWRSTRSPFECSEERRAGTADASLPTEILYELAFAPFSGLVESVKKSQVSQGSEAGPSESLSVQLLTLSMVAVAVPDIVTKIILAAKEVNAELAVVGLLCIALKHAVKEHFKQEGLPSHKETSWNPIKKWMRESASRVSSASPPQERGRFISPPGVGQPPFRVQESPDLGFVHLRVAEASIASAAERPLVRLAELWSAICPRMLVVLLDSEWALTYVLQVKRMMQSKLQLIPTRDEGVQTFRTAQDEKKLLDDLAECRTQRFFAEDQVMKAARSKCELEGQIKSLQERCATCEKHRENILEALDQTRGLLQRKDDELTTLRVDFLKTQEENVVLRKQILEAQQKNVLGAFSARTKQYFEERELLLEEKEVNAREVLVLAQEKERFDLLASLMVAFVGR